MPLDIGASLKSLADWFYRSSLVRGIVGNPIFAALLITTIVIVVLLAGYYNVFREKGWKSVLRSSLYAFVAVSAIFAIHHYGVLREARTEYQNAAARETFQTITQPGVTGAGYQVKPVVVNNEPWAKPTEQEEDDTQEDADKDKEEESEEETEMPSNKRR